MRQYIILVITTLMCAISIAQVSKTTQKAESAYDKVYDKPPKIGIGPESNENVPVLPIVPEIFHKGMKIEVIEYDPEYDVFNVAEAGYPEQGPFYFTPEELLKGTKFALDIKEFSHQKKIDFVGSEHVLAQDMKILTESEYNARKKTK